jgi:hypothetical protein
MSTAKKLRAVPAKAAAPQAEIGGAALILAEVIEAGEDPSARAVVRLGDRLAPARIAAAGYRPSPGDRVLVVDDDGSPVILAAVRAALAPAFVLADGALATTSSGALEVTRPDGALLLRYANGALEIAASNGDLKLAAPAGRVVIEAAQDVTIRAARDLAHEAGRAIHLDAPAASVKTKKLEVEARSSRFVAGKVTVLARHITTTAESIATACVRHEIEATKLIERTRDAFRDVADLAQTRVGRARTIVKDVYTLLSRRSVMVSKEDTSVDGKKILIG